jgi:hypothetical protein
MEIFHSSHVSTRSSGESQVSQQRVPWAIRATAGGALENMWWKQDSRWVILLIARSTWNISMDESYRLEKIVSVSIGKEFMNILTASIRLE